MTMREWMAENYPDKVTDYPEEDFGYAGGVFGCPYDYGINRRDESDANCLWHGGKGCDYCWGREMPSSNAADTDTGETGATEPPITIFTQ